MPLPRVFVSSVIEGLEAHREAARLGIEQAGGEPILVNEQFPSLATSSRNACLDAIDSCDIVVLIIGGRAGWRTPSGRFVIEEEFEHARSRKLPILLFVENVTRDQDADQIIRVLSDYVEGLFRVRFTGPAELRDHVERALRPILKMPNNRHIDSDPIALHLERPYQFHDQTSLRFAVAPERAEKVFDALDFSSPDFSEKVMELGHSREVRLFSYEFAKKAPNLDDQWFVVEQPLGSGWRDGRQGVRVSINEAGVILTDVNVTGRADRSDSFSMVDIMTISIETMELLLGTSFRFVHGLYNQRDPFKRYQRFHWNAALSGIGFRTMARNPQEQRAYTMHTSNSNEPLFAFDVARLITRMDLAQPGKEIERAVVYWTRQRSASR